ncbi:unnamed protein product [Mytilus edulis]|uniref:Endonuclease n=1 Tax=Mytilus edulis TaxID=6550 RepID=A0A8S3VDL8_MYTED|nr:unnamed protein product [Mytilus edulis]
MVKRKNPALPRPGERSEIDTETDAIETDTDCNMYTDFSEPETDDRDVTVIPKVSVINLPSTSSIPISSDIRPRRSLRLSRKREVHTESEREEPEMQSHGDTAGVYGIIKGAFQEMTGQLVTAIQSAFKGFHSDTKLTEKGETRKAKKRPTKSKSDPGRLHPVMSNFAIQSDSDDSSDESSYEDSIEGSIDTCYITEPKRKPAMSSNVKLPAYTGKEKWEVYYNRFEAVSKLSHWDDNTKLAELLPRLQGEAGDFAFDQLAQRTLSSYTRLTKEIHNRFGTFETKKNYKTLFNRRNQKSDEKPEAYAAELKRIYDKAYKNRDMKIRQEDLLQRFLMGLSDHDSRVHVELYKEPNTIEEAVQEVITFTEAISPQEDHTVSKFKKQVRQVKGKQKTYSKKGKNKGKKQDDQSLSEDSDQPNPPKPGFTTVDIEQIKDIIKRVNQEQRRDENIQKPNGYQGNSHFSSSPNYVPDSNSYNRRENINTANPPSQQGYGSQDTKKNFACYYCGQPGHFARNCFSNPKRQPDFKRSQPWNEGRTREVTPPTLDFRVNSNDQELTQGFQEKGQILREENKEVSHSSSSSVEVLSRNKSSFNEVIDFSQGENENLCSSCDDSSEQNLISPQFIGRQVLRSEGVYIEGHVQGTEVNFTVDTGASRTVLSRRAFQQIPFAKRPLLKKSNMLASADGKPLHELGKAIFDIKLGDLPFEIEVVVAEIEDEALLGLDVLMKADCGPANLRLSDGIMLLGDTSIPCQQIGLPERVRKIRVADNFSIPPRSEMLIDVFIDRYEDDQILGSFDFVLDPTEDILQRYPVVMAPTIVNIEKDVTSLVRILNPFDTEFTLYQDTVIGEAESLIKEPEILVSCEDKAEVSNFSVVRRIKLGDHKPVQWETNTGIIRNISKKGTADGGKSGIVPDHLQDLFLESTKERSAEECDIICNLLNKFSNAFSKNDMDLGLTNLTEHCIETGDARPVKQPPRRVPLAYANEEKKLVDQMLQQGIIQKSHSPWASPLVLVVKKSEEKKVFKSLNVVKTRKQTEEANTWTIWKTGHTIPELKKLQEEDEAIGHIFKWKTDGKRPPWRDVESLSPATRHYWHLWESLFFKENLLFKEFSKRDETADQIQFLTPQKLKPEILAQMHNSITSGHLGRKKTKAKLSQRFYWYEMREDITIWLAKCDICQANKPPVKGYRAPLGSMPTGGPWDRLATDILGPLPVTPRHNKYVLTVTDHFTKWVEVFPVPDSTAVTCAYLILNDVICRYGCPLALHSDQGRNYESDIFQELCSMLDIRKTRTSVRNPKGNGQTERFNRSLLSMIKSYLQGEQTDWDLNLGCLAGAYRSTPNESTSLTPNLLMLGREIRFPVEVTQAKVLVQGEVQVNPGDFVCELRERLQKAHSVARKHLSANAKRRKDYYDQKVNFVIYNIFDKVWYLNETRKEGISPKLQPLYLGPCLITKKLNEINFEIQLDAKGTRKVINHNKLKPYIGENIPKWMKIVEKQIS